MKRDYFVSYTFVSRMWGFIPRRLFGRTLISIPEIYSISNISDIEVVLEEQIRLQFNVETKVIILNWRRFEPVN
jgi:hypothetical protein